MSAVHTLTTLPTLRDAERYVGMPYQAGVFDCASLCVLVQRDLFGREIALPAAGDRPLGRRGQARDVALHRDQVEPLAAPETGCAALFTRATLQGRPPYNVAWHVGTVFLQHGAVWILHASQETRGVVLERLGELQRWGQQLEGYYRWL